MAESVSSLAAVLSGHIAWLFALIVFMSCPPSPSSQDLEDVEERLRIITERWLPCLSIKGFPTPEKNLAIDGLRWKSPHSNGIFFSLSWIKHFRS